MVTAAVAPANAAEEYPLYVVINEHSKMCLDVAYGSVDNGARIQQYYCYGGAPTKWRYKPLGNNVFQIINENSKKCLDLPYGNPNTPRGTTLQQWTCWDGVMQKWQIRQDGTNRQWISSVANPSLCLDVKDWNVDPGGTVQVWDCWDANVQKWRHFRQ
ncbi:RICIN domain-containing protein [Lentzea atacamensis]|nr:RICIN domain-containing protein [Lentzea atacamensis]